MSRPAQITIDLAALRHNLQVVKMMAPNSKILAMVKSNAYGHGLERISEALPDVDAFGVACAEEGLQLRRAGITQPIVLMEGLFHHSELALAMEHHFTLVIHEKHQVEMLENDRSAYRFPVWLKLDSGMHRLGFSPSHFKPMHARLMQCANVRKPIGLMTHFAKADCTDRKQTLKQLELFNHLTADIESGPTSISNSAGILAWPSAHGQYVRPGIMLYGASPIQGHRGVEHNLKPVMTLRSEIIALHYLAKGDEVGYGGTWTCPEDMLVGVVGIGYGDGYPHHVKMGVPILVNNRPCPLIGRVAMDMLTVDLRTQPDAKVGDPVLLWGPGLPVEVVAEHSDTTAYELLTRITQRVRVVLTS
jgi:alanine racemase